MGKQLRSSTEQKFDRKELLVVVMDIDARLVHSFAHHMPAELKSAYDWER